MHNTVDMNKFTPPKKCRFHRRGQVDFKNVILPLHEKHKQICFLQSTGSTILIFSTPLQRNEHFVLGKITAEGCQKWQIVIPTLHEKQKNICFLRSMEADFSFLRPLSTDIDIFKTTRLAFPTIWEFSAQLHPH